MWIIVRFELGRVRDYGAAFELLRHAGFQPHRRPSGGEAAAFPAAVVADVLQDPAVVTRAVFTGLQDAGLLPIGVTAAHVDVGRAAREARACGTVPGPGE
jgi:hypothetical protein